MKILNLKTKVIGPALLLIPMACMHLGDGHHSGGQHSVAPQPSIQNLSQGMPSESMPEVERTSINQGAPDKG
jgi:hypothetical protein